MNPEPVIQSKAGWGLLILGVLMAIYFVAGLQISPRTETGVRVIPWQAPDLEIAPASIEEPVSSVPEE